MAARTDDENKWGPEEDDDRTEDQKRIDIMQALGEGLEKKAEERVGLKQKIEQRWIDDIRQDCGRYPADLEAKIIAAETSEAFVNLTRPKRQMAESRLSDMLFPTDDRNFGIRPTPVPQMEGDAGSKPATVNGKPVATDDQPDKQLTVHEALVEVAKERAKNMEREIEDQLIEAKYHKVGREVIRDACLLGTGILKGPIIISRMRRAWKPIEGQDEETGEKIIEHKFDFVYENVPSCECVDPFHFFPDPSADTIENSESDFQRHYPTLKQMIEYARRPDFMADQVRKVLEFPPNETPPTYLSQLRELADQDVEATDKRYLMWEYHGPVSKEELEACGCEVDEDPLKQYEAVIFFCKGIVLKAVVNPMDTNERPYSVFNYEEDYASIFGYGVPYLLRNPQRNANAAYRMMMDNAGLSTGPQIVVNDVIIEPVKIDNKINWNLTARKLWRMKDPNRNVTEAFATFNIDGHMKELSDLLTITKQLCDLETNLPLVNQADEAPKNEAMRTARGMELLMNSNNVPMRRSTKNYDDNITVPFIGRWYNYNMQFVNKPEIKGDFQVDARGTSALLLKGTQARNIYEVTNFAGMPQLDPLTKWPELYRLMVQSAQIDPDEVVKTEEQIKADSEKQQQNPEADLERMKLDMQYAIHREKIEDNHLQRQADMLMRQMDQTIAMITTDNSMQLEGQKIDGKLREIVMKTQGDRQKIADEALIKAQYGSGI